jgi:hypothetical protein
MLTQKRRQPLPDQGVVVDQKNPDGFGHFAKLDRRAILKSPASLAIHIKRLQLRSPPLVVF